MPPAPPSPYTSIAIIGGGAWGTALATLAAHNGVKTLLWTRNATVVRDINDHRENKIYLPGIPLHKALKATTQLERAAAAEAVLFMIPTQQSRDILTKLSLLVPGGLPVAIGSKGIERDTLLLMPQVLREVWPKASAAMLSGPSFAHDVASGKPTAITLAADDPGRGAQWQATIGARHFRPYLSHDVTGAALGGAVKNVLAIAAGIVDGMALGESAHAALIARGFAEFQRLGVALGAEQATMAGLSGLGDLILTAGSARSRNMSLGQKLGQGESLADILSSRNSVSEGVASAAAVMGLADKYGIDMPICKAVHNIVEDSFTVSDAINDLMARPVRQE